MAGCPVCGRTGPGDPSVGIMEDDGLCPACSEAGWEESPCGCLTDPDGVLRECDAHEGREAAQKADENEQAAYEDYWHRRIDEALGK